MTRTRSILASVGGAAFCAVAASAGWVWSLGPPPRGDAIETSHVVLDRAGRLLRAYALKDGRWRMRASIDDVDPRFIKLLLAYEDRRFPTHHGVDPAALTRAALQLARERHIVSGGSTITMQVARLMEPREHRSFVAKAKQVTRAVQI
ncbi:MAG TPA: transglycosylase domain-containing protein, partial [Rhizomicrobium sp.]